MNKKGQEGGLLSRIVPALIVMALAALAFAVGVGDMQDKWGFNTSDEFGETYGYVDSTYDRVDVAKASIEEESSFLGFDTFTDVVLSIPRLVIDSFGLIAAIIGNSLQALGIPYAQTIGRALVIIAFSTIFFAIASIFVRGKM